MAENKLESLYGGYHDYRGEGIGDVFTDHVDSEWPLLKGEEVSEEEYRIWCESEGLQP
jgi:hypothetical protein